MSSTEAALLAAIAAMPEEDTPRLAFADFLDEKGDEVAAARAEFIRLQVTLYRVRMEAHESTAARRRAAALHERYADAWGFPAQNAANPWYAVRRGFIDEVTVHPDRPAEVPRLLQCEPVMRLKLSHVTDTGRQTVPKWLDLPALSKVRHVEMFGTRWTDGDVIRFLSFTHLPALTSLALVYANLRPVGASAIADCERLRGLAVLRINFTNDRFVSPGRRSGGGVRDTGVRALAASANLASLRELSLRAGEIATAGALALAGSPHLTALESLILTENPGIGPDGRAALVARFGDAVFLSPPTNP